MENKNKEITINILISLMVLILFVAICILTISQLDLQISEESQKLTQLTYDKCCDGNPCTDTYYSEEDNKCHMVKFDKIILNTRG